ncbi:MAG: DNA-3-methyladenine glycosylase [Patescibacteria group bacterium]
MVYSKKLRAAEIHLAANDPKLAQLIKKYGPCRLRPHTDYYKELLESIVGQQLSVKAADAIWKRVILFFGEVVPTPQQIADADTENLRACGLSYGKVKYMKDLAAHIIDGRLDLTHITSFPNNELIRELTAVKGIGQWSAHMFMIFSLGRLDILPVGDLGIRKAAMNIYNLRRLPSPERLIKLSKQNGWPPYESIVAWYLWRNLDPALKT